MYNRIYIIIKMISCTKICRTVETASLPYINICNKLLTPLNNLNMIGKLRYTLLPLKDIGMVEKILNNNTTIDYIYKGPLHLNKNTLNTITSPGIFITNKFHYTGGFTYSNKPSILSNSENGDFIFNGFGVLTFVNNNYMTTKYGNIIQISGYWNNGIKQNMSQCIFSNNAMQKIDWHDDEPTKVIY